MDLVIREIQLSDSEFIAGLSRQFGYSATIEEIQSRLTNILQNSDHCAYAAMYRDQCVGWIHAFYSIRLESGYFVEIAGLIIDEQYRRKGIGKKLIESVHNWAAARRCGRLRVRCNVKRNDAHEFYKGIGFIEMKEQKIFDKE